MYDDNEQEQTGSFTLPEESEQKPHKTTGERYIAGEQKILQHSESTMIQPLYTLLHRE